MRIQKSGLVKFQQLLSATYRASCSNEKIKLRISRRDWGATVTYAQKTSVARSAIISRKRSDKTWKSDSRPFETTTAVEGMLGCGR